MSTHTPGPWVADGYLVCIPADNAQIFLKMDTMADARLIAAAPDLSTLAHKALALVLKQQRDGTTFDECAEFVDEARAAIAKAEGTQS